MSVKTPIIRHTFSNIEAYQLERRRAYHGRANATFGILLKFWPNTKGVSIWLNHQVMPDSAWYMDADRPICWIPSLEPGDSLKIRYIKETWEQRTRRLLNKENAYGRR